MVVSEGPGTRALAQILAKPPRLKLKQPAKPPRKRDAAGRFLARIPQSCAVCGGGWEGTGRRAVLGVDLVLCRGCRDAVALVPCRAPVEAVAAPYPPLLRLCRIGYLGMVASGLLFASGTAVGLAMLAFAVCFSVSFVARIRS